MPLTRLLLILCYVIVAAGITVFLAAQMQPGGQAGNITALMLPLAMLAGLVIRALNKRLNRDPSE